MQIIENADGIVTYLMFNQAIYSEKKINMAVDVFSALLDRILQSEDPGQIKVAELVS